MQGPRRGFLRKLAAVLVACLCFTPPVQQALNSRSEVDIPQGDRVVLALSGVWPERLQTETSDAHVVVPAASTDGIGGIVLKAQQPGQAMVSARLFGVIPWKAVHVNVVPKHVVTLGGQAVGIRLWSRGPIIVGFQKHGGGWPVANPLQIGDVVMEVNHQRVRTAADLKRVLSQTGDGPVELVTLRHGQRCRLLVRPVRDAEGHARLGVYVRDRTTGVGTMTFYDPVQHTFGALGHVISDVDTGQPIDGEGDLVRATILDVVRGQAGRPGEKRGRFVRGDDAIGHVEENTPFGVFGTLLHVPSGFDGPSVTVATPDQVHEGPAKLYTVVHGERVEAFDVRIESVSHQKTPSTKSMVIRVTDPRLLRETGGIVQGMSGSPIVQDGRLVGAVTHVFVSDPTRGYGIYAQWMIHQVEHLDTATSAGTVAAMAKATDM